MDRADQAATARNEVPQLLMPVESLAGAADRVPSEQRRPALSHHDLSHTLKPLNTIKQHDLYQLDRVPTSPRCLVRAYLIGANGCLPRPLGTTQPPRNYYHLPARPDLGDVQAGLQPLGHSSQATAARGGMSEPWMPDESRLP